jgi:hypothetical protein
MKRRQKDMSSVTDQAFVQQEIIDASILDPQDIRCPRCKGNTLVLTGQAQVPQREIMEAGEITDRQVNLDAGGTFEVERIDCLPCNVTYLLREPKLFQLERENLDLKHQVNVLNDDLADCSGSQAPRIGGRLA